MNRTFKLLQQRHLVKNYTYLCKRPEKFLNQLYSFRELKNQIRTHHDTSSAKWLLPESESVPKVFFSKKRFYVIKKYYRNLYNVGCLKREKKWLPPSLLIQLFYGMPKSLFFSFICLCFCSHIEINYRLLELCNVYLVINWKHYIFRYFCSRKFIFQEFSLFGCQFAAICDGWFD